MYSKNAVPKNKVHLLKESIFVWTKSKTEHKRPICLHYFLMLMMLQRLDTSTFLYPVIPLLPNSKIKVSTGTDHADILIHKEFCKENL